MTFPALSEFPLDTQTPDYVAAIAAGQRVELLLWMKGIAIAQDAPASQIALLQAAWLEARQTWRAATTDPFVSYTARRYRALMGAHLDQHGAPGSCRVLWPDVAPFLDLLLSRAAPRAMAGTRAG